MIYRAGRVLDRRKKELNKYYHGHLIRPKRKLPRILSVLAMLILLPCFGVWLATSNFSMQPEQVAAEVNPPVVVPKVAQEPEKLPQKGPGSETNPEVQRFLHEWMLTHDATKWAVYTEELGQNRQIASVNADKQLGIASLYKLFIPNALVGSVPVEKWAVTKTSQAETRSIERCVKEMIRISDNSCGEALAERIGWSKLDQDIKARGYTFTNMLASDYLKGTARDTAFLLKDLYNKQGYSDQVRELMMTAMREQKYTQGIAAGCDGCTVYSKTGNLNGFVNDAAIIENGGKKYVLVVLSKGGSYKQIAELTKGIMQKFALPAQQ